MRKKTEKIKNILLLIIIIAFFLIWVIYYSYSFPRTMELIDDKIEKVFEKAGWEVEFSFFTDLSQIIKETVEKAVYITEFIEENINGNIADGKKIPVVIITCAAEFPSKGGRITSDFGEREDPITGKKDLHTGIDIAAAYGSEVIAAWPGIIVETGFDEIYGNYVVAEHSDDFLTRYCHLSKILVTTDDFVNSGGKIGETGSTGRSTGNHLHFEVIVNGMNIDPKECLSV